MNAIPTLEPITAEVITRPQYDNTHLDFMRWLCANDQALTDYWISLGGGAVDFLIWVRCQHDLARLRGEQS